MADEIKIKLTAEDGASSAIKKVIDALGNTQLGSAITAASTGFLALKEAASIASKAFEFVAEQVGRAIDAASEMEVANKKLALSLSATGEFTEESFNAIVSWSDSVEAATGLSNEYALSLVTLGKNMGMSTDQARQAAQAALDLSAATGISAEAAVRQLNATLNGNIGRLGQTLPALRNLTKAQLENGEAIALVAKQYEGFAQKSAQTFSGAMTRLNTTIENVYEAFGRLIVQNPLVIKGIEALISVLSTVAESVNTFAEFILNNMETIKAYGQAFLIVIGVIAGAVVAMNAAAIATAALTAAVGALGTVIAFVTGPVGLIILAIGALTVGVKLLIENFDLIKAKVQEFAGAAIQFLVDKLKVLLESVLYVVSIFDKDLADSISKTLESWDQYGKTMEQNGKKAAEMAEAQEKAGKKSVDASNAAAMAAQGLGDSIAASVQEARKAQNEYGKAMENAKKAFDSVKDLTPRIQLEQFKQDAAIYENNLKDLKQKAEAMKVIIKAQVGPPSAEDLAQLKAIEDQIKNSEAAIKAIRIKTRQETREAELKEVEIQLNVERMNTIRLVDEIMLKRIEAAQQTRDQLIQIETEKLLEERGLQDANARAGVDIRTQAQINANEAELAAYKAHLEAQNKLAVDMETQKQVALAESKANVMSGLGGQAETGATADVTVAREQARQQQLQALRQQGIINEQEYNQAIFQSREAAIEAQNQMEIQKEQERAAALGLTEEGLQARIDAQNLEFQQKMERLQAQHDAELISDQEFQIAKAEAERANKEQIAMTNQQFTQEEIKRHEALGESWKATLAKIRLEQQKHGAVLGAIRGIQASEEYKATNQMLTDLGSLRNSKSKEAFEVGKKAAIVQATINTFMSATAAYASLVGIPIVGPILATAAAAAALAAGFVNIQNINSQQFNPGGQADEGLDEVPASMSGRSFILSGGERVLQPEANREVTQAAKTINDGGGGINATFNLTFNGNPDPSMIENVKESIVDALRQLSERGVPIIHEKGVVRG